MSLHGGHGLGSTPNSAHNRSAPPTLGQHNEEILREELGLSREEIQALRDAKAIGERPAFA